MTCPDCKQANTLLRALLTALVLVSVALIFAGAQ